MHYHVEVYIPKGEESATPTPEDVEGIVSEILEPYNEERGGNNSSFAWDWYEIGGRWKGAHVPGYDIETDPANIETCRICNGTGIRPNGLSDFGVEWFRSTNGCNGCNGTGKAVKWPTQFSPHPKDVIPVSEVPDCLSCYVLIMNGKAYETERWTGKAFKKTKFKGNAYLLLKSLGITEGYLVTVDCHC